MQKVRRSGHSTLAGLAHVFFTCYKKAMARREVLPIVDKPNHSFIVDRTIIRD